MNEQTKLDIAAVDRQAVEIFNRLEQLADIDEKTFELIEPDLMACLETATIAGELTTLAELVESGELTVGAPAPAVEAAPASEKKGNSFFDFITDLFSDFPQTVVSLIADENQVAAKDEQKPEGDCCVDVEEPCMSKDNHRSKDLEGGAQTKKLPLAEDPQITICIAPSTSEYFKDAKNAECKDPKDAKPASPSETQPAGKLRPAHPEDQLSLADGLADPDENGGGMCTEDENGAYTCIIVPSHKDLASSLLKGARRMLGFSDRALGNAEKKLPKKDDDADKK